MTDRVSIDRLMQTLSEIMTDKHGVQITFTARKKPQGEETTTRRECGNLEGATA